MYKTIIAGVDASPRHKVVLHHAAEVANRFDARLHVVSVGNPMKSRGIVLVEPISELWETLEQHVQNILQDASEYLEDLGVDCRLHAVYGDPVDQIAMLANELKADLIIIGHRNLSWMERLMDASVSNKLLDCSACSILIALECDLNNK